MSLTYNMDIVTNRKKQRQGDNRERKTEKVRENEKERKRGTVSEFFLKISNKILLISALSSSLSDYLEGRQQYIKR